MKNYEIYMEGYAATGNSGAARYVGKAMGRDFESACRAYYAKNPTDFYNPDSNTYWGCQHYPTLRQARRDFG